MRSRSFCLPGHLQGGQRGHRRAEWIGPALTIHPNSATGEGEFTHKNAAGDVIASGTWSALKLRSFQSYGSQPDLPPEIEGGHAVILVQLSSAGTRSPGLSLDGGPRDRKVPALAHRGHQAKRAGLLNFNQKVSGFTVFIRE